MVLWFVTVIHLIIFKWDLDFWFSSHQYKGFWRNLPFLPIICSNINYVDGVLWVGNLIQDAENEVGPHMPFLANLYMPLPISYFYVFHFLAVFLQCSEKIVKDGHLHAFRYSISNCFLFDQGNLIRKGIKVFAWLYPIALKLIGYVPIRHSINPVVWKCNSIS